MSGLVSLNVHIRGTVGLIMHNGDLANPMNEHSRAISAYMAANPGTKNKTDAFYRELAFMEFRGGLYLMEDAKGKLVPCIPSRVLMSNLRNGAKRFKKQPVVRVGVIIPDPVGYPLIYEGPTDAEAMFSHGNGKTFVDQRMMKVNRAPILRTRAIFRRWELKFDVQFDPQILNKKDLVSFVEAAGQFAGIGDSYPEYGRYEIVEAK